MGKEITMTFGKHKGKKLSEIPLSYLGWLLGKYEGLSLCKKDLEAEAIKRGCEKRNGRWGIMRTRTRSVKNMAHGDMETDFLGNTISCNLRDDWDQCEIGEDIYEYEGIPNT